MNTSSFAFPNMFDVARNTASISEDRAAIVSRVKLLILTEPTELYMNPTFGVGIRKYIFQYNNDNVIAAIKDKLIEQLRLWEPCVDPDATKVEKGLKYTGNPNNVANDYNELNLTITLTSIYGDTFDIKVNEIIE